MKAKEMCFIEGSGCNRCQTPFEPDDEICFDSNYCDKVRVMHIRCAGKNGRILGLRISNEKYLEGLNKVVKLPPAKEPEVKKDGKTN